MNHRIEVTRAEPIFADEGVDTPGVVAERMRGIRFVGQTDDGDEIAVHLDPEHWELLGRPESFVLRIRP